MTLLERIARHAARQPQAPALEWAGDGMSYSALVSRIEATMAWLAGQGAAVIALDLENGPDWVITDIAALSLGLCVVPLPRFFSPAQMRHAISQAGVDVVISDRPAALREMAGGLLADVDEAFSPGTDSIRWIATAPLQQELSNPILQGVHKVTFTSGSTGQPKGVLLSWQQMREVVASLHDAVGLRHTDRHLSLMPLAVLLENLAGAYTCLWAGACLVLAPMQDVGMRGATQVDGRMLLEALTASSASTAIFTPQTLKAVVEAVDSGRTAKTSLRFAAVGGASVSRRLLERAAALGIPAYEGYGLSECASVVCLNTPESNGPGTVGRPLPHVQLATAADGEVIVRNSGFLGYLDQRPPASDEWHTGDLGAIDDDGYLRLKGRCRNLFITAAGRNVSPEWVERELMLDRAVEQAAVFGDARPFNVAVIKPADDASDRDVDAAIVRANAELPDYARVSHWIACRDGFTAANTMLTGTGRVRRDRVWQQFQDEIQSVYNEVNYA